MSILTESKIDTTHRLENDGRWLTASRFRHNRRAELRAAGQSKSAAREHAWIAMGERFPPVNEAAQRRWLFVARIASPYVPPSIKWRFRTAWAATFEVLGFLAGQSAEVREATDALSEAISSRLGCGEGIHPKQVGFVSQESVEQLVSDYSPEELLGQLRSELIELRLTMADEEKRIGVEETCAELDVLVDLIPLLVEHAEIYWPIEADDV
jgi:hypothetical protein